MLNLLRTDKTYVLSVKVLTFIFSSLEVLFTSGNADYSRS